MRIVLDRGPTSSDSWFFLVDQAQKETRVHELLDEVIHVQMCLFLCGLMVHVCPRYNRLRRFSDLVHVLWPNCFQMRMTSDFDRRCALRDSIRDFVRVAFFIDVPCCCILGVELASQLLCGFAGSEL